MYVLVRFQIIISMLLSARLNTSGSKLKISICREKNEAVNTKSFNPNRHCLRFFFRYFFNLIYESILLTFTYLIHFCTVAQNIKISKYLQYFIALPFSMYLVNLEH